MKQRFKRPVPGDVTQRQLSHDVLPPERELTDAEKRFIDFLIEQALELLADRSHEPQR